MKAPIPESEEQLIVDFIYIDYLIQTLENDLSAIPKLPFKLPESYQGLIEHYLRVIRKGRMKLKEKMKELKIKVEPGRLVNVEFYEYEYFAHGYQGSMRFWDAAMKMKGSKILSDIFIKEP